MECGSFGLLILTFFLSFLFLFFWIEAQNDYNDFDWLNFGTLGFWFPWSLVLLVVAATLFTFIALLLTGIVVTLVFSVTAIAILSDLWSKEWKTLLLSLQVTAPVLHVVATSVMTILSWPIAMHFFRMNKKVCQVAILGLYLSVLFSLYLVSLGMYSPCIEEAGTLRPAPSLFGHRGAPVLALENTVMSFEKAVEAGGEGLETDVTVSYDGVPFLMHDSTLRRTTNIVEVFPNRTHLDASMFTWAELQQLNASDWFLSRDPFGTVSSLSEGDCTHARNHSVPSLAQFLDIAACRGRLVLFDLHRPPYGHPYIQSLTSLCRWYRPTSTPHSKYLSENISTNLYVINQPWLYSLAWCAGAKSVTTNSIHILSNINTPLFLMSPEEYSLMWILTDAVSAFLLIAVFIFHWCIEANADTLIITLSS